MEFKSQICTTKDQSERLLTLGLRPETADMSILTNQISGDGIIYSLTSYNELIYPKVFGAIPAWSLHRLIEMIPPYYREQIRVGTIDNPYEYMYQIIGRLVYSKEFNNEYLEK